MKSAYGRRTLAPDYELTGGELGSPMGELLRRYWQPVCTFDELHDLPRKEKLLCKRLSCSVTNGAGSALSTRIAPIAVPRSNGAASRRRGCAAAITAGSTTRKASASACRAKPRSFARRWMCGSTPTWRWNMADSSSSIMGPPSTEPLFPRFDILDPDRGEDVVLRGMRLWGDYGVCMVKDCNLLQHLNIVDPFHLLMLHQWISGDQFEGALMQGEPTIGWEKTALGVRYNLIKDLPNGNRMVRHAECIVPNMFIIPGIREPGTTPKRKERGTELSRAVPVDTSMCAAPVLSPGRSRMANPSPTGSPGRTRSPTSGRVRSCSAAAKSGNASPTISKRRRGSGRSRSHALENLAHSDTGIVMLRRLLREQLQRLAQGLDPINVIRDTSANKRIPTGAWNTILSPAEAAALPYCEDL